MAENLINEIVSLCGEGSRAFVNTLYAEGLLDNNSVRNFFIRKDFDEALKNNKVELIKNIFIDLSDKYDISIRQVQRIVYDYMKNKVSNDVNTK